MICCSGVLSVILRRNTCMRKPGPIRLVMTVSIIHHRLRQAGLQHGATAVLEVEGPGVVQQSASKLLPPGPSMTNRPQPFPNENVAHVVVSRFHPKL